MARSNNASRFLPIAAHAVGLLAAILLLVAGMSWVNGDPPVVAERSGLVITTKSEHALAGLVALYKGLLDLWPIPLAAWFALRREYTGCMVVWLVATGIIPIADIVAIVAGRGVATLDVHLLYLAVM